MSDASNRLVHQVRQKAIDLTGERACSWCFRKFPIEKLTLRKRGNGHKAYICTTCLSAMQACLDNKKKRK